MNPRPLLIPFLLALLLGGLAPEAARGQGHPMPPSARPLHARLANADVVVVASVESVETGRIALAVERHLLGEAPDRFEVKRSPTQPPPLSPGDRALLILRGARPPYVVVDEPREIIRLVDDANAERWASAVAAVLANRDDPEDLVALYLRWSDDGPATLRDLGVKALGDRAAPFQPLSETVLLARAEAALDPSRSIEARRAAVLLAMRSPAATERLLAATPRGDGEAERSIAMAALQGGAVHRGPGFQPALLRALAHSDRALRLSAIRISATLRQSSPAPVIAALQEIVATSDDAELREEARRALVSLASD